MRKFIFTLLIGLTTLVTYGQDPIVLKIANVEVAPGTPTVTVDVTIDGFVSIQSAAFSLNYDSLVLKFNSITNFNSTLGLSNSNFGFPGVGSIKPGRIRFLWDTPMANGQTIPNNSRLFSIVFDVLGGEGSMSAITQSNADYVRNLMQVTNFSSQNGSVRVRSNGGGGGGGFVDPCPDAICASPTRLLFYGDTVIISPSQSTFKMPIRVKNYTNVLSGDGSFSFDSTKLKFVSIKSDVLLPGGLNFVTPPTPNLKNGTIRYSYFDNDGVPRTFPDGTVLFEITFEKLGGCTDTSRICLGREPIPVMEWFDGNQQAIPFCIKAGTVICSDTPPAPPVKFKLNMATGDRGTTLCLDMRVENFTMIQNFQYSVNWNPRHLEYISTGMYDLPGLSAMMGFSNTDSTLNVSWNTNQSLITLADNHRIFQICFRLLECGVTSPVTITGNPLQIEVNGLYNGMNDFEFDTELTHGSITINPCTDVKCDIMATNNTSCFGSTDGSVTAMVMSAQGSQNCMCVWKNSAGVVIKSTANLSDCNLINVAAGSYTLELICAGVTQCTSSAVVGQPDRINIPGTGITNPACGVKGSINVTGITGGNPPYTTFNWNPNVGNTANVTNLNAGTYMLMVTDSKGCTGTQTFVLTSSNTPLSGSAVATPVKCFGGNDGSITVTPSGGCPPYTVTPTLTNLTAGNYTVTITDASVPVNTFTLPVTVTQPSSALSVDSVIQDTQAGMSTGSINLIIAGGTPNYTIVWSGTGTQIAANTNPATNLSAGTYNVTVTDANGCTATALNIIIKEISGPAVKAGFETVGVSSNFNGFGVDCNGNCNGVISGNLASGTLPVRLVLKIGNVVLIERTVTTLGTFEFNNLCAGNYIIEGINVAGTTTTNTLNITTPSRLVGGNPLITCEDEDQSNGSITLNISTGVPPYTYTWSTTGSTTNVLSGLEAGVYAVTVTDLNNCFITLGNLDVRPCNVVDDVCGKGNLVLTPNGDQQNDFFAITCSEDLDGTLSIYDRWGRLVYNKAPYDNSFIGIDNKNEELIEGSYIWIYEVNYGNGLREVFDGTLTILK